MLLVINGAPGIGKSTVARRYVDAVPIVVSALATSSEAARTPAQVGDCQTVVGIPRPPLLVEVCLTCAPEVLVRRFQARRNQYVQLGIDHPESDLDDDSVVAELTRTNETLVRNAHLRNAIVLSIDDVDTALASLRHALGTVGE